MTFLETMVFFCVLIFILTLVAGTVTVIKYFFGNLQRSEIYHCFTTSLQIEAAIVFIIAVIVLWGGM